MIYKMMSNFSFKLQFLLVLYYLQWLMLWFPQRINFAILSWSLVHWALSKFIRPLEIGICRVSKRYELCSCGRLIIVLNHSVIYIYLLRAAACRIRGVGMAGAYFHLSPSPWFWLVSSWFGSCAGSSPRGHGLTGRASMPWRPGPCLFAVHGSIHPHALTAWPMSFCRPW